MEAHMMQRRRFLQASAAVALPASLRPAQAASATAPPGFPRLMAMNIGEKNYHRPEVQEALARYHVAVLDFFPKWRQGYGADPMGEALRAIKRHNPALLVAQYSTIADGPLNDPERVRKLDEAGWWLREAGGQRARWTSAFNTYDVNITDWTAPDAEGRRYPEWLVERDYRLYHQRHPEVDIWYFDNAMSKPMVKRADWEGSGRDRPNDDARVAAAFRRGHASSWRRVRQLQPGALVMANTDDLSSPEYAGQLDGAFLEALMGKSWSVETWGGWGRAMQRYQSAMDHTRGPRLVGFGVVGRADDYRLMRYGLASCLMDDGYFAYSTLERQYSTTPWFDEFDLPLGSAIDPPQRNAWQGPVYRRRFAGGMALLNPSTLTVQVDVPSGYRRFQGRQEPDLNNGRPATRITLGPKDGLLLELA
jgi:hypothetical protein